MGAVLLDTEALLLWTRSSVRLSKTARRVMLDPSTRTVVSAASVWEIAIKQRKGRLELPDTYFGVLFGSWR